MPFGHYRDRELSEIPDNYLSWLNTISLRPALREAVEAELERRRATDGDYPQDHETASRFDFDFTKFRCQYDPDNVILFDFHKPEYRDMARELVKAGHRQLALRYHPDNRQTGDPAKFRILTEMVEMLRQRLNRQIDP